MKKKNIIAIVITIAVVTILFFIINFKIYKNDYNNIDSYFNWLTSSTIKFTNCWLEEGATNLRFIMYEEPNSIEYEGFVNRKVYISYPPGTIIIPYVTAKILNIEKIDFLFVKYMVTSLYLINSILIAIIFFCILKKLKIENLIYRTIISIFCSVLLMVIPVISYYLRNIYFADQAIITIALMFILLELNKSTIKNKNNKMLSILYNIINFLVILFGVLTEYYFWFVLFIAFCIEMLTIIFQNNINKKQKLKACIKNSFCYIIPLLVGIILFWLQISQRTNWQSYLINRFNHRTSLMCEGQNSYEVIIKNIINIYTLQGACILLIGCIYTFLINIFVLIKKQKNKELKEICKICNFIMLPVILHMLVFANHSAYHDFSTIKVGLPFVLSVVIIGDLCYKIVKYIIKKEMTMIRVIIIIISLVFGMYIVSRRTNSYIEENMFEPKDYEIEKYLQENAKYNEVYIAFDFEIPINPPQQLAISGKRVYKVRKISEIYSRVAGIKSKMKIILITNKNEEEHVEEKKKYKLIDEIENYQFYEIIE